VLFFYRNWEEREIKGRKGKESRGDGSNEEGQGLLPNPPTYIVQLGRRPFISTIIPLHHPNWSLSNGYLSMYEKLWWWGLKPLLLLPYHFFVLLLTIHKFISTCHILIYILITTTTTSNLYSKLHAFIYAFFVSSLCSSFNAIMT
jgi:hypothetical protein